MKRNALLMILSLIALQFVSCKKFLEEKSQTDVTPTTATAFNELLLGEGYFNENLNGDYSLLSDDVAHRYVDILGEDQYFDGFIWQARRAYKPSIFPRGSDPWDLYFKMIQICNLVIELTNDTNGSQAEKENAIGQAHLLRAFYYFNLVNYYGKPYSDRQSNPKSDLAVPLMLRAGVELTGKKRNTVEEVYQQILSDLDKGTQFLTRSRKPANNYRISHIAGHLLASRVHLHMGNWEKAINSASAVLDLKPNLMDLTAWGTPDRNQKTIIGLNNPETIWAFGESEEMPINRDQTTQSWYVLSNSLINLFEEGDLRRGIYFNGHNSHKRMIHNYSQIIAHTFRVSEALLNRAEAYARLHKAGQAGYEQLALDDLNKLRENRILPSKYQALTSVSADDLLQKCLDEKRREFFDEENHRWFDLRRNGMPAIVHTYYESATQVLNYRLEDHDLAYIQEIPGIAYSLNPLLVPNPAPPIRYGY